MALIWDNHACIPLRPDSKDIPAQLERYRASGVSVVSLNICWDGVSADLALPMAEAFRACVSQHPDRFLLVETVADIDRALASSRLGVVFDIEGGTSLKGDVAMVSRFYELGVRWMLLTYNRHNELGGGCLDADNPGLTDFGRAVLDEMCRVGMVPCCSHVSERSAREVLERSTLPVIFSHSNARAVCDHPRNISDAAIRACARTGGVVGINGIGPMVGAGPLSVDAVLAHVCHVANLVGPEHVALGLDYDFELHADGPASLDRPYYIPAELFPAEGFSLLPPESIKDLAHGLEQRGWGGAAVAGFLGGNLRRVASRAWKPRATA
jgi:membrane dipeptidase